MNWNDCPVKFKSTASAVQKQINAFHKMYRHIKLWGDIAAFEVWQAVEARRDAEMMRRVERLANEGIR